MPESRDFAFTEVAVTSWRPLVERLTLGRVYVDMADRARPLEDCIEQYGAWWACEADRLRTSDRQVLMSSLVISAMGR